MLLIQGLSCDSVDPPTGQGLSYMAILNALDAAGFATMRVDKSGVGRSSGGPCKDTDFLTEVQGFRAALHALRDQPFVDPNRVFVLGHSLGGLIAPLLAGEPVAGFVVYGADATPWREYELANARRQWQWQGASPASVEARYERWVGLQNALYTERIAPLEAVKRFPEFQPLFDDRGRYQGRTFDYFLQLAAVDWSRAWSGVTAPVLVAAGDSDALSLAGDQEQTARIVNGAQAGLATFVRVPCADHWFRRVCGRRESLAWTWAGPFHEELGQQIVRWLLERSMSDKVAAT